jgi:hypothetical protein
MPRHGLTRREIRLVVSHRECQISGDIRDDVSSVAGGNLGCETDRMAHDHA